MQTAINRYTIYELKSKQSKLPLIKWPTWTFSTAGGWLVDVSREKNYKKKKVDPSLKEKEKKMLEWHYEVPLPSIGVSFLLLMEGSSSFKEEDILKVPQQPNRSQSILWERRQSKIWVTIK